MYINYNEFYWNLFYSRYKSAIKSFLIIKEYNWIKEVYSSDHKPVYAIFEMNIPKKTQNEKVQSSKTNNSKTCLLF